MVEAVENIFCLNAERLISHDVRPYDYVRDLLLEAEIKQLVGNPIAVRHDVDLN